MTVATTNITSIFQSLPGNHIILSPDVLHYNIIAATDEYLRQTHKKRELITGHPFFEVLPGTAHHAGPADEAALRASLSHVLQEKTAHELKLAYNLPTTKNGIEKRHTTITNKPVLDENGEISYIIHTFCIADNTQYNTTLQDIFQQSPMAVCTLSVPGLIMKMANEKALLLWDRTAAQVMNKNIFDSFPELKEQGFDKILIDVYTTGNTFVLNETPIKLNRNGVLSDAYINFVYEPIHDASGKITSIMGCGIEVTAQVLANRQVAASEAKFRELILHAPAPMVVYRGPDQVIEIANEKALALWGLKWEDVADKPAMEVFPTLDTDGPAMVYRLVYSTGQPIYLPEVASNVKGPGKNITGYFNKMYEPLLDEHGKVNGVVTISIDITEQVEARQRTDAAEERLRIAVEATALGDFEYDIAAQEMIFSKRLQEIFGFDVDEKVNHKEITTHIHPDDMPIRLAAHKKASETGVLFYEIRLIYRDSTIHWMRLHGKVIYDEKQNPVRILGTVLDITMEKEAQEALQHSEQQLRELAGVLEEKVKERTKALQASNIQLEKSNNDLEQFAYIASHDLQEPLRKIQTFSSILEKKKGNEEEIDRYLSKIDQAAARMSTLIKNVLDYSRLSSTADAVSEIDLETILKNVQNDLELLINDNHATIEAGKLPVVKGIPYQLNQLFVNLISNAIKFSTERPYIHITAHKLSKKETDLSPVVDKNRKYVLISFKDNGIGFDPQYKDKIFTIFKRLNTTEAYTGTGIGLALCRKIAENHGGYITATGTPGHGATFSVCLPLS